MHTRDFIVDGAASKKKKHEAMQTNKTRGEERCTAAYSVWNSGGRRGQLLPLDVRKE
jgi:hypothetical protein